MGLSTPLRGVYDLVRDLNYRYEVVPRSHVVDGVRIRSYEPLNVHRIDVEDLLESLCEDVSDGETVYDVGANVGTHTLVVAGEHDVAVDSFEPNPGTHACLASNVAASDVRGEVETHRLGLSDRNDTVELHPARRRSTVEEDPPPDAGDPVEVPVRRLDSLVGRSLAPPDRLKIDVEGHGPEVLGGARRTLREHAPTVYVEPHANAGEIHGILTDLGYDVDRRSSFLLADR